MIGAIGELDYFSAYIRLRESEKSEEKAEGVEAVVERSEEVTMSPEGLSYPKSKASVRRERESISRKTGLGGGECRGKLQVPRQGGRVEAKELHKTGANELLIKIAESEGLRIDAGVLDQGTK
ncbi:hypothetical protein GW17_00049583 [Ensete ventricosum]|nr:hypothetical protein GW17_00049583 [Ensete ventricosum]